MTPSNLTLEEYVRRDVAEGLVCTGAQVYVSVDGKPIVDWAYGISPLGRPVATGHLYAIYCNSKPILAMAYAAAESRGLIDVGASLGDVMPEVRPTSLASVTLASLLAHRSGIWQPSAIEVAFMSPQARHQAVLGHSEIGSRHSLTRQFYSEYSNWHLLELALEWALDEPAGAIIRRLVLQPTGLEGRLFLGMTGDEYDNHVDEIEVNADMRGPKPIPLLIERTRRVCTEGVAAHGAYSSMRTMGMFYEEVMRALGGESSWLSSDIAQKYVSAGAPASYDPGLRRKCTFGLGFMTNLPDHLFGTRCSTASFGHSGMAGSSFVFADPEASLVAAILYNGMVDSETAVEYRRSILVDKVYRRLEQ